MPQLMNNSNDERKRKIDLGKILINGNEALKAYNANRLLSIDSPEVQMNQGLGEMYQQNIPGLTFSQPQPGTQRLVSPLNRMFSQQPSQGGLQNAVATQGEQSSILDSLPKEQKDELAGKVLAERISAIGEKNPSKLAQIAGGLGQFVQSLGQGIVGNQTDMSLPGAGWQNRLGAKIGTEFGNAALQTAMWGRGTYVPNSVKPNLINTPEEKYALEAASRKLISENKAKNVFEKPSNLDIKLAAGGINAAGMTNEQKLQAYSEGVSQGKFKTSDDLKVEMDLRKEQEANYNKGQMVRDSAEETLRTIDEIEKHGEDYFGILGNVPWFGGGERKNWEANINKLKATQVLDTIKALKDASKTGATGFGALSDRELAVLERASTALQKDLAPQDAQRYLNEIKAEVKKILERQQLQGSEGKTSTGNSYTVEGE